MANWRKTTRPGVYVGAAFSIKPQLQVVHRRYDTSDEEIDLVVKNNVARPFWQGLGSPLLFIECKNWASRVGAPEIRNFEGKLQNRAPMTRIGILVAPGRVHQRGLSWRSSSRPTRGCSAPTNSPASSPTCRACVKHFAC